MIGPTVVSTGSAPLVGQCLLQSHSTGFCVWSQTDTATAAGRCTMPRYDLSRQVHTSMSRWALVLLRHNSRFQVFRPAVPRKSSHFLKFTEHESFFRWHAVQRSRFLNPINRENNVFVRHLRLANPDFMVPSLIQIACRHGCVLVHHSFSEWQHLARVRFLKNTHKLSFFYCFSLEISSGTMLRVESTTLSRCCRLVVLSQKILK